MFNVWVYALVSVVIVSLISLVGIFTFAMNERRLEEILIYMISFSAGALFGDAFIHMLPEAVKANGFTVSISLYVLSGIAFSFVVEKLIHWRHCHHPTTKSHPHNFAMMNLFGDAMHNFIDGLIIGASYLLSFPVGIATTVAVILHEIPQEIGDFGVLLYGGYSKGRALFMNFLIALTAVLGVVVALLLNNFMTGLTTFLVPFAAGSFIYIAGSDLIPELHREVRPSRSILQLLTFILGVGIMLLMIVVG